MAQELAAAWALPRRISDYAGVSKNQSRSARGRPLNAVSPGSRFLERDEASILSPLRYPGSKRRLAGYIARVLELNGLDPQLFIEPFAGGSSVALQLLNDGRVKRIGLADIDPLVAAFWQTVFWDTDWLIEKVRRVRVTLAQWLRFKSGEPMTTRDRALTCLFLNRTSYSGILAPSAGPIGGKAQESDYTIDCRFPRKTLIRRIRQAAALAPKVAFVWNLSWKQTVARVASMRSRGALPGRGVFFYFDPPFFKKADALYPHFFKNGDHAELRAHVRGLRSPWLLSYDAAPEVREMYGEVANGVIHVEQLYSVSGSRGNHSQREAIITNLDRRPRATRLWRRSEEWG